MFNDKIVIQVLLCWMIDVNDVLSWMFNNKYGITLLNNSHCDDWLTLSVDTPKIIIVINELKNFKESLQNFPKSFGHNTITSSQHPSFDV